MRIAVLLALIGVLAGPGAGAPAALSYMPTATPLGGGAAGYYFWDSYETSEWAPVYGWFEPTSAQGWRGDDAYWSTSTPFDIRFCGQQYPAGSTLYVGSNGILGLSENDMDEPINQFIPDSSWPNCLIAPLWDNLRGYGDGEIYLDVAGTAPERKWYLTYSPWYFYNAGINPIEFQVVIFETDLSPINNTIEFHYKDMDGDSWRDFGTSATVGLENGSGVEAVRYSFNQPVIPDEFAIRFIDQNFVDDQIGEFHLVFPPDGYVGIPGETIHFSWQAAEYSGHGILNYTLYLADNSDFNDPLVFDLGGDTGMDYIFGSGDTGTYWWKVLAGETDIGLTRWSEEVFTLIISSEAVQEVSWGFIKAGI